MDIRAKRLKNELACLLAAKQPKGVSVLCADSRKVTLMVNHHKFVMKIPEQYPYVALEVVNSEGQSIEIEEQQLYCIREGFKKIC